MIRKRIAKHNVDITCCVFNTKTMFYVHSDRLRYVPTLPLFYHRMIMLLKKTLKRTNYIQSFTVSLCIFLAFLFLFFTRERWTMTRDRWLSLDVAGAYQFYLQNFLLTVVLESNTLDIHMILVRRLKISQLCFLFFLFINVTSGFNVLYNRHFD